MHDRINEFSYVTANEFFAPLFISKKSQKVVVLLTYNRRTTTRRFCV